MGLKKLNRVGLTSMSKPAVSRTSRRISDWVVLMITAITTTVAMIMAKSTMVMPVRKRVLRG